jgi:hypothetical protein
MRERIRGWEGPLFLLFAVPLSRERLLRTRRIAFRALRRGVGYRLEFRLLSYVNTQLRSPCEKAWAPIVQRVRFSATKAQPFWQVEW